MYFLNYKVKIDKVSTSITFYLPHIEIDREELNKILEKISNKLQKDLTPKPSKFKQLKLEL